MLECTTTRNLRECLPTPQTDQHVKPLRTVAVIPLPISGRTVDWRMHKKTKGSVLEQLGLREMAVSHFSFSPGSFVDSGLFSPSLPFSTPASTTSFSMDVSDKPSRHKRTVV